MATGRVTRNRTGAEPLETEPGTGTFATGSIPARTAKPPKKSCRNRETAGKNHLNRIKEPRASSPGPNRFTRTNGAMEPPQNRKPDRSGLPGPTVPWNRTRNHTVTPD